jgi:DNA-binding HxlR family transcriptional regulator
LKLDLMIMTHGTPMKLREPLAEIAACCSLPQALETMGERWSFMILRASFNGLHHFEEFLEELGIARNILSNRLTRLVESGILKRAPCVDDRRKIEYRLTDKGLDLLPTMIALRQWGEKWESGVPSNPVLVDERDRRPIQPISIRAHDGRVLTHHDLCWIDIADLNAADGDDSDHDGVVKRIASI